MDSGHGHSIQYFPNQENKSCLGYKEIFKLISLDFPEHFIFNLCVFLVIKQRRPTGTTPRWWTLLNLWCNSTPSGINYYYYNAACCYKADSSDSRPTEQPWRSGSCRRNYHVSSEKVNDAVNMKLALCVSCQSSSGVRLLKNLKTYSHFNFSVNLILSERFK